MHFAPKTARARLSCARDTLLQKCAVTSFSATGQAYSLINTKCAESLSRFAHRQCEAPTAAFRLGRICLPLQEDNKKGFHEVKTPLNPPMPAARCLSRALAGISHHGAAVKPRKPSQTTECGAFRGSLHCINDNRTTGGFSKGETPALVFISPFDTNFILWQNL